MPNETTNFAQLAINMEHEAELLIGLKGRTNDSSDVRLLRDGAKAIRDLAAAQVGSKDADGFYLACYKRSLLGSPVLWWQPNDAGYTTDLNQAGIYLDPKPGYHDSDHTVPVPVSFLQGRRIRHEIDPGDSDNTMFFTAFALRTALMRASKGQL